jgi:acetate kinase
MVFMASAINIDRLAAKIASFLPNLGGVDALIFTGGVGEHDREIRAAVASKLAFLGVEIDSALNDGLSIPPSACASSGDDRDLATPQSQIRLLAIHTQEEWQIAKICWEYLRLPSERHRHYIRDNRALWL